PPAGHHASANASWWATWVHHRRKGQRVIRPRPSAWPSVVLSLVGVVAFVLGVVPSCRFVLVGLGICGPLLFALQVGGIGIFVPVNDLQGASGHGVGVGG